MIPVRVREVRSLAPTLRQLRLEPADGGRFPVAAAGSHAVFRLPGEGRVFRNAYSLADIALDGGSLGIVVRRCADSRGGSVLMHAARYGDVLDMTPPQNLFAIPKLARAHVLLSAGIGVTPFLAYAPALRRAGVPFALHQFCRSDEAAAFAALLPPPAQIHAGALRPSLAALLADHAVGTHVSVCGPESFMAAAEQAARAAGFAPSRIHRESFAGPQPGAAFVARLARSARRVAVPADLSLLEALELAGFDPPHLCRAGVCGQCRLSVLSGTPEHRDHVLSPAERQQNAAIMTCVSRAATPELELDF